ncbi:hypothetical protein, partial [Bacteroides acidifaciens]|uniref:hypothetical protein n=1 Tax=Bacteroides acidifaciens TaxID=85831 RepID=UPI0025845A48
MRTFITCALTTIGLSLGNLSVQARSWRINSNPDAKANFTSINAAMESLDVFKGDTLYLDPGCCLSNQTISKGVTIIGPGYNVEENTYTTQLQGTTKIPKQCSNVKIEGCYMESIDMTDASNITIERCKIGYATHNSCSNVSYLSCFIYGSSYSKVGFEDMNHSTFIISNCIILNRIIGIENSTITNNVIIGAPSPFSTNDESEYLLKVTNSSITNNIIIHTSTKYSIDEEQRPYYYKNNTIANTAVTDNNT